MTAQKRSVPGETPCAESEDAVKLDEAMWISKIEVEEAIAGWRIMLLAVMASCSRQTQDGDSCERVASMGKYGRPVRRAGDRIISGSFMIEMSFRDSQSTSPDRSDREPYHPSLRQSVLRFRQPG
jgi:hypothetical protein